MCFFRNLPTSFGDGHHFKLLSTVDGRNPAPVDKWFIQLVTWFHTCQLVQDFFHEQYELSFMGFGIYTPDLLGASSGEPQLWTEGSVTDLRVSKIPSHNRQPHRFQSAHLSGWRICHFFLFDKFSIDDVTGSVKRSSSIKRLLGWIGKINVFFVA